MSSILGRVCVYLGEGACEKNAAVILSSLKQHLCSKNVNVNYITTEETITGTWRKSTLLYVIGGGYDLGFINALGDTGTQQIRDYVLEGGSYLGLCAGAYFASDHIEFDKGGPLEVCGERKLKFYPGVSVGPVFGPYNYTTESGARAAKIKYSQSNVISSDVSMETKQLDFKCYFNGGGMFLPYKSKKPVVSKKVDNYNFSKLSNSDIDSLKNTPEEGAFNKNEDKITKVDKALCEKPHVLHIDHEEDEEWYTKGDKSVEVEVLANYEELSGSPASIVKCKVGKGIALLSGPHIEYNSCNMNGSNEYLKLVQDEISNSDNEQNVCFSELLKHLIFI